MVEYVTQYSLDVVKTEAEDKSCDESLDGGPQRLLSSELLSALATLMHNFKLKELPTLKSRMASRASSPGYPCRL
jgi:hypothetical protein